VSLDADAGVGNLGAVEAEPAADRWYNRSMTTFAVVAAALQAAEPVWLRYVLLVAAYLGTLWIFQRKRPTAPLPRADAP